MRAIRRTLATVLITLAAAPAAASASAYSQVLHVYEFRGTVPPCAFTAAQLSAALKGVDVYGQQYFADFTSAIQTALSQRAGGACTTAASGGAITTPASGAALGALRIPSEPLTAATSAGVPLPLLLLGGLALAALAGAAVHGRRRRVGADLAPPGAWRHLWGEAGWRAGGTWADFRDWAGSSRPARRPRG